MSTLIICPACNARYEIAAVIPPSGRKVRCSKCGHVWQATAVIEAAKPPVVTAPQAPAAGPRPAPMAPRPAPPEQRPGPLSPAMGRFAGVSAKEPNGQVPTAAPAPAAGADASFGEDEDFQADRRSNGDGAGAGGTSPWPGAQPSAGQAAGQDYGSFNAGVLTNPDEGAAAGIAISGERRKVRPPVAIGWGLLALLLIILAAMMVLAPKSVVSVLPGAARLYAMMGKPVSVHSLAIQDVHATWSDVGGAPVLNVEGNIVNLTADNVPVPDVVIALQDETGKQIAEVTAKLAALAAGARAPFKAQIPSPPKNLRSLKVRFAKAV